MTKSVNTAVAGGAWGDEGKGKVVDEAAKYADFVFRAQGGPNAGHSMEANGKRVVGHLISSGALAGAKCRLGRGVRVDLNQFFSELDDLAKVGIFPDVQIDHGAFLLFDWHKALEQWAEMVKGSRRAYTTMRGMCSTAAAIALRVNPKISMLLRPNELEKWLWDFYQALEPIFTSPKLTSVCVVPTPEEMMAKLLEFSSRIEPYLSDVRFEMYQAWQDGKPIVFEGAQGLLLDPDWSPSFGYNTQGLCGFAGLAQGTGLPLEALGKKISVFKALYSRVGNGGFPSELGEDRLSAVEPRIPADQKEAWASAMLDKINKGYAIDQEIGQYFRVIGGEYGATTNRPRRIGWLNLAEMAYSVQVNGPDELAFTKIDCLSGLKRLKFCIRHRRADGSRLSFGQMPELTSDFENLAPEYWEMDGWSEDITGETDFDKLPRNTKAYIRSVEGFLGKPITVIGTGPDRDHVIKRKPSY